MLSVSSGGFQFKTVIRYRVDRLSVSPHGDQRIVEFIGEPIDGDLKKCHCGVLTNIDA
jgi:hypothetical protein